VATSSPSLPNLGTFDFNDAALHHFPDTRTALRCLRDFVWPGGTFAIVALAHGRTYVATLMGRVFMRWHAPAVES
jgi:hypothetical protein